MRILLITSLMIFSFTASAQSPEAFRWKSRLIVLFTPTPDNALYREQLDRLLQDQEALRERKLVVLSASADGKAPLPSSFLSPKLAREYYAHFGVKPGEFVTVLVGLDGGAKYRAKGRITAPEDFFDLIDTMPMRRQELRQRGGGK
jgi:hypothetical protein